MKRLFSRRKNSSGKLGEIMDNHPDFFRLLDCPSSSLPVIRKTFHTLTLLMLLSQRADPDIKSESPSCLTLWFSNRELIS